ncbi:MAG: trypsin-like serine protease [Kofleriaceae bacterium]
MRALLLLFLVPACGIEAAPTPAVAQGIVGGTLSEGDDAVVALVARNTAFCSGTLVAPRLVVTAAHCLPPNAPFTIEEISVSTGLDISQGGARVAAVRGKAHPAWRTSAQPNDVGILELAGAPPIEPVALASGELVTAGAEVRVLGYGVGADGAPGGVKRTGRMKVARFDASTLYLKADPVLLCSGDSGGPIFLSTPQGEILTGVHSRSDCTRDSRGERLDVHTEFLRAFALEGDPSLTCTAEDCSEGCPVCPAADRCDGTDACAITGGCQSGRASLGGAAVLLALAAMTARQRRRGRGRGGAARSCSTRRAKRSLNSLTPNTPS